MISRPLAPQFRSIRLRQVLLSSAMLAISAVPSIACAQAAGRAETHTGQLRFNVPAQDLDSALTTIADRGGIRIFFMSADIAGIRSSAVSGTMSVEQALSAALTGTGFTWRYREPGTVVIESVPESADGAIQLGPVRVEGGNALSVRGAWRPHGLAASEKTGTAEEGYLASEVSGVGPFGQRILQDTPYSISVVSSDLLENTFSTTMDQIAKFSPTLQLNRPSHNDDSLLPSIRGFRPFGGSAIFDGFQSANAAPRGIGLADVERLEILSGLSGFLYGGGHVGGAINYVLKRPTPDRLTKLSIGNYGGSQYFGHLDLGGPIDADGRLGYRLNALYQNGETSINDQNIEQFMISGAWDWRPADSVLLQLHLSHRDYELNAATGDFGEKPDGVELPDADLFNTNESYTPDWAYFKTRTNRASLKANWDIDSSFSARLGYSFRDYRKHSLDTYPLINGDGTYSSYVYQLSPLEYEDNSAFAYLDAGFATGSVDHELTIGAYGGKTDTFRYERILQFYFGGPYDDIEDLNRQDDVELMDFDFGRKYLHTVSKSRSIVIGDEVHFSDRWSALVGVNYSTITSNQRNVDGERTSAYEKSAWTPTFSLIFKPVPALTTYASYMESLEQGAIVGDRFANAGDILPPLVSKQYEVGAKFDFNDRILLTGALFRIEKANQFSDGADPLPTYVQDGREVHEGLEITLTGKATEHLTVIAGGTFMNLSIEDAESADLQGKKPVNTASNFGSVYLEYAVPGMESFILTGGISYTGSQYVDDLNSEKIPSYTIVDMGVRYTPEIWNDLLTFRLNVSNLTDEKYFVNGSNLGTPTTIAFSASARF